jgi:predicted Zn finger-like uncharacterized protein
LKVECPRCKVVYEIDDSKVSHTASHAQCPKCQFGFHLKSMKTERVHKISCPNSGREQKRTPSCRNCGTVFEEYHPEETKRPREEFRPKASSRSLPHRVINGIGAGGIALILNAHLTAVPIGAYFFGLFLIAGCIAGMILVKRSKPWSVLVSDEGISVAGPSRYPRDG